MITQDNTREDSYIPASSTSVSSQCRGQSLARCTFNPRPPLVAVSGAHRFQVSRRLVYRCLHGLAPRYLSDHFQRVTIYNRRRLRSSSSSSLLIRRTRLITVGDRALPVAGSRLWNSRHISSHSRCLQ